MNAIEWTTNTGVSCGVCDLMNTLPECMCCHENEKMRVLVDQFDARPGEYIDNRADYARLEITQYINNK